LEILGCLLEILLSIPCCDDLSTEMLARDMLWRMGSPNIRAVTEAMTNEEIMQTIRELGWLGYLPLKRGSTVLHDDDQNRASLAIDLEHIYKVCTCSLFSKVCCCQSMI
jgi:hypothetical protein